MNKQQIVVTGSKFTGLGFRAFEPVIEELIESAQNEIQLVAYLFSGSIKAILDLLRKKLESGVKVTIVINRLEDQSYDVKSWLILTRNTFPHARIIDFQKLGIGDLHAKVIIADRQEAVIGSANFSWGGMVVNHEIGIYIKGSSVWDLASLIDCICENET